MDSRLACFPRYMVFCVSVSCIGSFSVGWTIGSPNIAGAATHECANGSAHVNNSIFPDCLPMDSLLWGVAVSTFCIGGLVSSLLAGPALTRFGRRKTIAFNNFGWIVGGAFMCFATSPAMFVIGRLFSGFSCGMGSVATPTYNGEVSTIQGRGAMGTLNQLYIVIGILLSNLIGLPFSNVPLWRVNYALVIIPAVLQIFLMPLCVESPRYLVSIDCKEDARCALQKLRGKDCNVDDELHDIIVGQQDGTIAPAAEIDLDKKSAAVEEQVISTTQEQKSKKAYGIRELFTDPVVRRITLTVLALHAVQQFSAVNGVMYYSTIIFRESFDQSTSIYMAIATSGVNLLVTLLSVALIDRLGRRFLLLLAQAGGCITALTLAIGGYYQVHGLLVASVFLFVSSFAIGLGPIPWLITSELSPTHAASSMTALATSINWASNFVIGLLFPVLMDRLHSFSFLIFGGILLCSTVFTVFYIPETKGKSIEEINAGFERAIRKPKQSADHDERSQD